MTTIFVGIIVAAMLGLTGAAGFVCGKSHERREWNRLLGPRRADGGFYR